MNGKNLPRFKSNYRHNRRCFISNAVMAIVVSQFNGFGYANTAFSELISSDLICSKQKYIITKNEKMFLNHKRKELETKRKLTDHHQRPAKQTGMLQCDPEIFPQAAELPQRIPAEQSGIVF